MEEQENGVLQPRNTWELFKWVLFKQNLLEDYSDSIGSKQRLLIILRIYTLFVFVSIIFYIIPIFDILNFDLPTLYGNYFSKTLSSQWSTERWTNFQIILKYSIVDYFKIIFIGLIFGIISGIFGGLLYSFAFGFSVVLGGGLIVDLTTGFAFGLSYALPINAAGGLAGGIAGALIGGLAGNLGGGSPFSQTTGFVGGLTFGLPLIIAFGITESMAAGVAFGLAVGLLGGIAGDLSRGFALEIIGGWIFGGIIGIIGGLIFDWLFGLVLGIIFIFFYFRIFWWLVYSISILDENSLKKNPHFYDGSIAFPIIGMANSLTKKTFEYPESGRVLIDFLFKNRPYQRSLALLLSHTVNAGNLKQNRLDVPTLRLLPKFDEQDNKFRPTDSWYTQLTELTQQLDDSQKSSNIWQRKKYFEQFNETLNRFYETTLRESPRWNKYYIIALERWKKSAADQLRDLELEAQTQEPICPNIYRGGEKLDPALDKPLFLGRDDLRDTFKSRVLTAQQMPLFFIQGQRRTGKSSLLNFLPDFLDRGFRVVQIDLQTLGKVTVPGFFQAVYQAVCQTALPDLPENWVDAWQVFKEKLEAEVAQDERKLVLAIDEYEELHRALHEDPEQGAALLAAVRSFSQSQNRVVLLFAGADFMSELSAPNWNEYFVQTVTLDVDYLSREDSKKLIGLVGLRYEAGLPDLMYEQTQGHPCLLQKLCQEIVANANKALKNDISRTDYDIAVQNAVLRRDNGVIDVFWGQFCKQRDLKDAVRQILRDETPADKVQLLALEDHGFIVRDGEGWRMRVPLFTAWLERYEAL